MQQGTRTAEVTSARQLECGVLCFVVCVCMVLTKEFSDDAGFRGTIPWDSRTTVA